MIYITSDFAIAGVKELTARFKKVADSDKAFLNLILQYRLLPTVRISSKQLINFF